MRVNGSHCPSSPNLLPMDIRLADFRKGIADPAPVLGVLSESKFHTRHPKKKAHVFYVCKHVFEAFGNCSHGKGSQAFKTEKPEDDSVAIEQGVDTQSENCCEVKCKSNQLATWTEYTERSEPYKLQGILPYQHWWSTKEPKRKKLYLVATDGRPSDPTMVKKAITRAATGYWKRSESHTTNCAVCANLSVRKIGIQFVQIGDDREATEYLVGLDDDLELPIDIVDTTTASPEDGHLGGHLVKALVGAVIGYYDREQTAG
ncbi:hypothetical protein B0H14DRAFT_2619117 [Mycena olivaceomarginata]|nr:hypothetical protein B0H14DRAFT_2619117 [Mycena olivaceomarginata]